MMRLNVEPIDFNVTEIKLHQISRILEISFDNGETFKLPCEYLRVYTQSAEALGHGSGQEILQVDKQDVCIKSIKPVGNYGIAPCYSDGHDSGIYTWALLYKLGSQYQSLWANYLQQLDLAGLQRKQTPQN